MPSEFITPVDPATGGDHEAVAAVSASEVQEQVRRSRLAQYDWRFTPPEERAEALRRVADALEAKADEIGTVITSEMGRVRAESVPEVTKSASFFRYFADIGPAALAETTLDISGLTLAEKTAVIRYEPRGVVAVLKPWNAPVQQIVWAIAPALMAGCAVVVKPSEYAPRSALALQEALDSALPRDVAATLPGGPETGEALVDADVDMVTFTGSIATGRKVAAAAGNRLRKCLLELSGKDALIVDPAVSNLDLVAAGIVYGAYSNCGHWCSSIERVLLPSSIAEELTAKVVALTEGLRVGPGYTAGVDVGPIANRKQFEIVRSIVDDAVSRGARVLTGGAPLNLPGHENGYFFAPTVLSDVPLEARLTTENVFGPVVAIEEYEDVDQAVSRANDTNYGLGLSVWTDSAEFAEYVIARSDTGMVWVNEPLQSLAACPWSVTKESGYGSELGASGLREFTYEKVVQSQLAGNSGPRPWYFPYA